MSDSGETIPAHPRAAGYSNVNLHATAICPMRANRAQLTVVACAAYMPLFAIPAFQRLLAQESRLLDARLSREHGRVGLTLEAAGLPLGAESGNARLRLMVDADGMMHGSLRARADALPLADNSVDIVVIRHTVECVRDPQSLVAEALRVLAGRGALLVTGIQPLSLWSPWTRYQAHISGIPFQPVSTASWRQWLGPASVHVSRIDRFGPACPWLDGGIESIMGGGYLLLAHKQRMPMTGIPVSARLRRVPSAGATACVSRRRCA